MKLVKEYLNEDMGGVSSPISTPNNTPGMGNAQPPSLAATTAVQFTNSSAKGSGDNWGNSIGPYTQGVKKLKRKKKIKKVEEDNINPFDKLGVAMAKKMDVKLPFKKYKNGTVKQKNYEHIETLDEFEKILEDVDGQPEKQSKINVKYTDQTLLHNEKCSNCGWFKNDYYGQCGIVEGQVNQDGWCMLWGTKQFCSDKKETDESLSRDGLINKDQAFKNKNMSNTI